MPTNYDALKLHIDAVRLQAERLERETYGTPVGRRITNLRVLVEQIDADVRQIRGRVTAWFNDDDGTGAVIDPESVEALLDTELGLYAKTVHPRPVGEIREDLATAVERAKAQHGIGRGHEGAVERDEPADRVQSC